MNDYPICAECGESLFEQLVTYCSYVYLPYTIGYKQHIGRHCQNCFAFNTVEIKMKFKSEIQEGEVRV